jgi:hypothetical protein
MPTSHPPTAAPQRRPARLAAPIRAGVTTSLRIRLSTPRIVARMGCKPHGGGRRRAGSPAGLACSIQPSAWNKNSRKFISTIPDIHSYRAGAELYSSTSSMLWKGSCGQFALDWFGLHSILVPPPGTMISCPTYSIFPGKRKSSSMHRNVLSTSFRSGSLAIFPLAVGGLFLALSMHELRRS